VEIITDPVVEYGIAKFTLPGEGESGDGYVVCCTQNGALIAAIDGIGHGEEAANAAKTATSILMNGVNEPIISLVEQCHETLRSTRGVVMSLASLDLQHGMMTWLGVGNVQGVLMRASAKKGRVQEMLLLRAGVVGSQLPPLQAAVVPIARADILFFATDGIRGSFVESLSARENPQRAANRILGNYRTGSDDALVLVVRPAGTPT
jgi:negative regulator of sigma-B (phosphoserine phosphatase)